MFEQIMHKLSIKSEENCFKNYDNLFTHSDFDVHSFINKMTLFKEGTDNISAKKYPCEQSINGYFYFF